MISIKTVLNSSVVLVEENSKEMIALGERIGFGQKAKDEISGDKVDKIFLTFEEKKYSQLLELVEEIPIEFYEITRTIVFEAEKGLDKQLNPGVYLS
ncbi:CAT RNA binding domain-containing protein [Enterococcus faecium]|uniref:CAT RNA binding domain-containing protein n=1 Tax=Enterococcus faecium TaxID=1352 RepID=UPI003CC9110A